MLENHIGAREHIETSCHHRGSMNQRGNWCGTSHSIGQPDMQWKLSRLAASTDKQSQRDPGHDAPVAERLNRIADGLANDIRVLTGAKGRNDCKHRQGEPKIT